MIWWSGPSVAESIRKLPKFRTEIGCNHIETYRPVDTVVAYDRPIVTQLNKQGLTPGVGYYTQSVWSTTGWRHIPHIDKHYNQIHCSGTLAVEVAIRLGHTNLLVAGADWDNTNDSLQQAHYEFRGHKPNKMPERKRAWLVRVSTRCSITWVHPKPKAWMAEHITPDQLLNQL